MGQISKRLQAEWFATHPEFIGISDEEYKIMRKKLLDKEWKKNYTERIKGDRVEWIKTRLHNIKTKCKRESIPFDIKLEDVLAVYPEDSMCPILRIPLICGSKRVRGTGDWKNNPSIDRGIASIGYVRGNIRVISLWANSMKSDCCDPEIFRRLAEYMESFEGGLR